MKTIALIAQKGGTGKMTLALSLAVAAELTSKVSVIIDLDPQATACNWADRRKADTPIVVDAQPARLPKALEKAGKAVLILRSSIPRPDLNNLPWLLPSRPT